MSSSNPTPDSFHYSDISFKLLMKKRINNILIISSPYDYFVLQEDGRLDEQVFNEYAALGLNYPPQFFHADTITSIKSILDEKQIDLIIFIYGSGSNEIIQLIQNLFSKKNNIPIVLLTSFTNEIIKQQHLKYIDRTQFDFVFYWLGQPDIILAIIKLIEDRMNVEQDVKEIGVQTILLVENSVRFYSYYLPLIYKIIFRLSNEILTEGLNAHQRMLRLRGRPKILLATNYEEASELIKQYKHNLLGVISDINFERKGNLQPEAGIELTKKIHKENPFIPIILQSSDLKYKPIAHQLHIGYIHKYSANISAELKEYFKDYFAFGDFIFRHPQTFQEIDRASDLHSLQHKILTIPDDSFLFHVTNNHISKWLKARAFFEISILLEPLKVEDFNTIQEIRTFINEAISNFRITKISGEINRFNKENFNDNFLFSRIGDGSIGGKARGLAFIDFVLKKHKLLDKYPGTLITIPRTVVIATDLFDEFMEMNNLFHLIEQDLTDDEILHHFVSASLPSQLEKNLNEYLSVIKSPIVIRSSGLLEDSYSLPLAGIYKTYMIPFTDDSSLMNKITGNAIKCVYTSLFYKSSRNYLSGITGSNAEEKMGVIFQEVCGMQHKELFYPTISGIARSINYYPISPEKPEDGVAYIAYGLGKYICDGGLAIRFSPSYPKKIIQLSSTDSILKETQKEFCALDLNTTHVKISTDEGNNIFMLPINSVKTDDAFKWITSTYDHSNNIIRDGNGYEGKKLMTFSGILNHTMFPLADIVKTLLNVLKDEMKNHIEIEFAVELNSSENELKRFNVLQVRPITDQVDPVEINIQSYPDDKILVRSSSVLGNGIVKNIFDFIYVKTENYSSSHNQKISDIISRLNDQLTKEGKNYILVGPGRWGSLDPFLGIPVKWEQISGAKAIIELCLENYRIEPSQGTHFFYNLTSSGIGYFTVNPFTNDDLFNTSALNNFPSSFENDLVRHVKTKHPFQLIMDGKQGKGIILKPEK